MTQGFLGFMLGMRRVGIAEGQARCNAQRSSNIKEDR